jgi:uncharacterized membrane protein YphA (DoxX/SURF4 family)
MTELTAAIAVTARIVMACVFLVSSTAKARKSSAFVETLTEWGVAPRRAARALAWAVIAAEFVIGACLATGIEIGAAALAALALLGIFTTAAAWQIYRGQATSCNCLGVLQRLGPRVLMRNFGLMILAAQVVMVSFAPSSLLGPSLLRLAPALTALGLVVLAAASWELSKVQREVIPRRGQ